MWLLLLWIGFHRNRCVQHCKSLIFTNARPAGLTQTRPKCWRLTTISGKLTPLDLCIYFSKQTASSAIEWFLLYRAGGGGAEGSDVRAEQQTKIESLSRSFCLPAPPPKSRLLRVLLIRVPTMAPLALKDAAWVGELDPGATPLPPLRPPQS